MSAGFVIRNVEVGGRGGVDVRLSDGLVAEIGAGLRGGEDIDGQGGALIPGLTDHHIHLLALAAQADSVSLSDVRDGAQLAQVLTAALDGRPPGAWVRATGYHEAMAGLLDRDDLDRLAPGRRLRVQHQTGSLWILNSLALESVLQGAPPPACVETDAAGRPTGRIWRGDAWLREHLRAPPPPLALVGRRLAGYGITALTDASANTDATSAALLATAARAGDLPQRLRLMSAGPLDAPPDAAFTVGPAKVLLDDHDLPDLDDFQARIQAAREQGRAVAVHCVTAAELAITLAAFDLAGARPGDRIEHGGVIPPEAIARLVELGLIVVTQPAFVAERGDRYLRDVEVRDQGDLYRCASLMAAGVPVAGSSDAPYTAPDPWAAMRAAMLRRTRTDQLLGEGERVDGRTALGLYLADPRIPGGASRRLAVGQPADLCLLRQPLAAAMGMPSAENVRMTWIGGQIVAGA